MSRSLLASLTVLSVGLLSSQALANPLVIGGTSAQRATLALAGGEVTEIDFLDARSPRVCRTCGLEPPANPGDTTGRDGGPAPLPTAPEPSRGGDDR